MPLPNLIIAGAPKCGTSSVFSWLTAHPEVCGSTPKETFYLMDKGHPLCKEKNYHIEDLLGYQDFFCHCPPSAKVIVEATTHYIYQQTPITALAQFPQLPKVVFILRKPEQRVYSSFQFTKNNLARLNKNLSFAEYANIVMSASPDRLAQYCYHPSSLYVLANELKFSCYINYLKQWQATYPGDIHILLFEDLIKNKQNFMQNLADTLGISSDFYANYDFPKENITYSVKNKFIHRLSYPLARLLTGLSLKQNIKKMYLNWQTTISPADKTSDDIQALKKLNDFFRPYNQELASLFKLDLSPWN